MGWDDTEPMLQRREGAELHSTQGDVERKGVEICFTVNNKGQILTKKGVGRAGQNPALHWLLSSLLPLPLGFLRICFWGLGE